MKTPMMIRVACGLALLLTACGETADDPAAEAPALSPEALYQDDRPLAEGKTDSPQLPPAYAISDYGAVWQHWLTEDMVQATWPEGVSWPEGTRLLAIRTLKFEGEAARLVVHADTLETALVTEVALETGAAPLSDDEALALGEAPYLKALEAARGVPLVALGEAQTETDEQPARFTVTIDMCQSRRTWELELYTWLVDLSARIGAPVEVGVALTGLWAHRHPEEMAKLIEWRRNGALDLTWINHSFHHQLSKTDDGRYLFLTASHIDFPREVMLLEQLLLAQGELPSVLFRFPGLTHDDTRRMQLADLSLFALDANGWIAKGEPIQDGAVVLLHGNGNEAIGVEWFFDQVAELESGLTEGQWRLADPVDAARALAF